MTPAEAELMTYSEYWPEGRELYYEGDDPNGFAATIRAEFGFDPVTDPDWGVWVEEDNPDGGYRYYPFHCPSEHLEAVFCSGRFPIGS